MPSIKLRDYQEKARRWANQQVNAGRHALIVMPCGTGKSKTAAMITSDRISIKEKVLLIVPQDIIQEQLLVDFSFLGSGYINQDGIIGRNRNVYIAMAKSLYNMLPYLPEKFIEQFSVIITDETQFSSAETWRAIYDKFPKCKRIGLTATPYRMDNQSLGEFYNVMYEAITMSEAIKKGYLCKPIIYIPENYKAFMPEINADINIDTQRELILHKKIIGNMIELYNDMFNGAPVIIPAVSKEHAIQIEEMFLSAGWNAKFIHGFTHRTERKKIIRGVKTGIINNLIVVGVGIYGMDIPNLAGIIWARYTESLTIYMQLNGRPMRPCKGKEYFIMIDMVGNSIIHNRCDIDRKWSLDKNYDPREQDDSAPKMKICPVCSVMNAKSNLTCHICGFDFQSGIVPDAKKRKLPVMIDGRLIILDADKLAERKEEIQAGLREQRKAQEQEKKQSEKHIEITKLDKVRILKNGLESKSGLFADAIKNWL